MLRLETSFVGHGIRDCLPVQCLHCYKSALLRKIADAGIIEKKEDVCANLGRRFGKAAISLTALNGDETGRSLATAVHISPQVRARDGREPGKMVQRGGSEPTPVAQTEAGKWLLAAVNVYSPNRQVPRGRTSKVRRRSRCCASWLAFVRPKYDRIFLQPSSPILV